MATINYATEYSRALAQAYPYVLNFGDLYATPNNGRYRFVNAKTIEIPSITVGGRVNSNRDTIATATRNYDNAWEPKTLSNQRKWSTLVHPQDIDQTNQVASIQNITQVMNEEQKFPEMDAYLVSKVYADWVAQSHTANTTALSSANVLTVFDALMKAMTKKRVNPNGRILYVTPDVDELIKNAQQITRSFSVQNGSSEINRVIKSLDQVKVNVVPPELMLTAYNFSSGWTPGTTAKQIKMFLVHPNAVITPVSYQFAQLDPPSAGSEGKYVYFEESFEDVFILNKKSDGIQFVVSDTLEIETTTSQPDAGDEQKETQGNG